MQVQDQQQPEPELQLQLPVIWPEIPLQGPVLDLNAPNLVEAMEVDEAADFPNLNGEINHNQKPVMDQMEPQVPQVHLANGSSDSKNDAAVEAT